MRALTATELLCLSPWEEQALQYHDRKSESLMDDEIYPSGLSGAQVRAILATTQETMNKERETYEGERLPHPIENAKWTIEDMEIISAMKNVSKILDSFPLLLPKSSSSSQLSISIQNAALTFYSGNGPPPRHQRRIFQRSQEIHFGSQWKSARHSTRQCCNYLRRHPPSHCLLCPHIRSTQQPRQIISLREALSMTDPGKPYRCPVQQPRKPRTSGTATYSTRFRPTPRIRPQQQSDNRPSRVLRLPFS